MKQDAVSVETSVVLFLRKQFNLFIKLVSILTELKGFKSIGFSAVETASQLKEYSKNTQRKWSVGISLKPALE